VGSGKSSVLRCLSHYFSTSECRIVREPVEHFRDYRDEMYNPLLQMQDDPLKNAFSCQMHILGESALQYGSLCRSPGTAITVSDRSICSPYAFIDCFYRKDVFSQFSKDFMLGLWQEHSRDVPKPDFFVFIDTPPARCRSQLIGDRSRNFMEHRVWTESSLSLLRASHEKMFRTLGIPTKRIEVEEDMTPADVTLSVISIIDEENKNSLR